MERPSFQLRNRSEWSRRWGPLQRLEKAAPEVVQMFNRVKFDQSAGSAWSEAVYVKKQDPAQVAQQWVTDHPDVVKSWLGM